MTATANIALAFAETARRNPDLDAIIAEDITLTFGKLWRVVERFAAKMQALGIGRGSVVGIDTTDMIVSVASIFALSLLGAQYIVIDRDFVVGGRTGITHFLRSPERPGIPGLDYAEMDASWSPKYETTPPANIPQPGFANPGDICWILGSSGTTGRPKFVSIDQETVWNRLLVARSDYEPGKTRVLLLFACNSRPFGIRAVAALLQGCAIIDSHSFPFLLQHGVNLVCGSPAQLRQWLNGRTVSPRIARLQVSGAKLDDATVSALLQSFDVVEDVYGSSETIAAHVNSMRLAPNGIERTGRTVASVVEIVDEAGNPVAPGANGAVRIRNGHMARGYDGLPEETARRFRDGWFYPGDMAAWGANGVLQVLGRSDDVVNLGGRKANLADIDAALCSPEAVALACAFLDPFERDRNQLAACVLVRRGSHPDAAVRSAWVNCARIFGIDFSPKRILVVDDLATTQDGVPRRGLCRQRFIEALANGDASILPNTLFDFQAVTDAK